jgi:hypothetical protein
MPKFIDLENIQLLWDIISNDEFLNRYNKQIITDVFYNNIKGFNKQVKTTNLMEMNKMYILLITNYVKKNCVPIPKITITNEEIQEMETEKETNDIIEVVFTKKEVKNIVEKKRVNWKDESRMDKIEFELDQVKTDISVLIKEIKRMNAAMQKMMIE